MSRWFRFYDEVVEDPKVQQLPDALFKAWVNLLCLASKNEGKLPSVTDIAFKLRIKPERAYKLLGEMRLAGLIEDDGEGNVTPHNWSGRQFKSDTSNDRVKRHRDRYRNVTPTVTATPPYTETEAENRSREDREENKQDPSQGKIHNLRLGGGRADDGRGAA